MPRPHYDALPDLVRDWVDVTLGSPVVSATSEAGGFSPGVAARVGCADGRRAFVKAASGEVNAFTPSLHRREAEVTAALPPSVGAPALLGAYDDGGWVLLLLEQVDGRPPAQPWRQEELAAALDALDRLAEVTAPDVLRPAAEAMAGEFGGWQELAAAPPPDLTPWEARHLDRLAGLEQTWPQAAEGDRLLHLDARGDNMLVGAAGGVVLVDWPWAARGNPVLDVIGFAPSAVLAGAPPSERLLASTSAGRKADAGAVTALLCAFAGLMQASRRRPAPPGMETVRAFQAAQGDVALRWLAERTGWR